MEICCGESEIYLGRRAGRKILKAIKNAKKSVKIVSPYLSPSYLERLVALAKEGKEITLITSDKLPESRGGHSSFKHSDVIKQKKIPDENAKTKKRKVLKVFLIVLLVSLIFFALSLLSLSFLYLGILSIIASVIAFVFSRSIKTYSSEYSPIFKIKIFDSKSGPNPQSVNLVHSKIFVIDEKIAFLGSANFTYSGFETHYETVINVKDIKSIKAISKEVENLYNSTELDFKSIDDWGKEIYEKFGIF